MRCLKSACPELGRLQFLGGVLALSDGEPTLAVALLEDAEIDSRLSPFRAYYLGEALFYCRRFDEAVIAFGKALEDAPASLRPRALARLAEANLSAGRAAEAAALLDRAIREAPAPELFASRARARRALGDARGESADLRVLWLRYPLHPSSTEAERATPSKKSGPELSFRDRVVRAKTLLDGDAPTEALAEVDAVLATRRLAPPEVRSRAAFLRAQVLYALHRDEEGDRQLANLLRPSRSLRAEAELFAARRLMRAQKNPAAREQLLKLVQTLPGEPPAEEASYLIGWIDSQAGNLDQAIAAYDRFLQAYPRSRRRDEAEWFRALVRVRQEKYSSAEEALQALVQRYPDSSLVPQARYWAARSRQLADPKSPDLPSRYEDLIRIYPGTFYALLAAERLRLMDRVPPAPFPRIQSAEEFSPAPSHFELAEALFRTGLLADAALELDQATATIRSVDGAIRAGRFLTAIGDHGRAYALATRLLWGEAYSAKREEALTLVYPRAFRTLVETEATARQVDPHLLWAIMRRESAFRATVESSAAARGLMQIIARTAVTASGELGGPPIAPDDLFFPQANIRLGAFYVSRLLQRFRHPVSCAAAYNAGPPIVARWVAQRPALELDRFVEEIPYRETRAYVKQVVADYYTYRSLYGAEGPGGLDLKLPAPLASGVDY